MEQVKYIKTYTNYTGRQFMRFTVTDDDGTLSYDIIIRSSRNASIQYTRREAKAEALRQHNLRRASLRG